MSKSKSRKKKTPKRILALPDLEHAKTAVLNSLTSVRLAANLIRSSFYSTTSPSRQPNATLDASRSSGAR
jgi:hypothetical protein